MAVLKDLIVHGRSRFVNGAQFNTINAESIGATQGIFNELIATTLEAKTATIDDLTANNATVVGLLDVQGELHTNSWTNANIANIGGSFYISPTVEPTDGSTTITITRNSATSWTIQAAGTFATDFVKSDKATAGVNWPANSLVLITGDVVVGDMVYPLGTLKGTLSTTVTASAASTSKTITITGVTDAQNNSSPSVLQQLYEINNNQNINSAAFKNGKISLYKLGSYPIGILMTSMGTNSNSLIDIYGGASTNPSVRIGHLAGAPQVNGTNPTGWGIYTDNGYFSGVIVSTSGQIAKFTINDSKLYSNGKSSYSAAATNGGIYIGDDYISFGDGAKTYFYKDGTGKVGPWTLTANALFNAKSSYNNANAGVYIGTDYIAGGAGEKWWLKSDGSAKIGAMTLTKEGVLTVPAANVSGALTAATLSVNQLTSGTISSDILTSNNIVTDTITMGTAGSNAYIYVSKNNKSATINGESTSWRIILGNTFGVTESGYLTASSGKIGGWTIGTNDLSTGSVGAESGIKFSNSTFDASINGATRSNLMFSIGSKFGVDKDGNLYASGANITGITTDTITGGTVGSQHFVYLSTNDYGTAITVGPGTNMPDWKLIVGNRFGVDSYGNLFANKAILTEATISGKVTANDGKIGKWSITSSDLYYTSATPGYSSSSILLSPDGTSSTNSIGGSSSSSHTWKITVGTQFGVTSSGELYANSANISGKIAATSGTIGAASAQNKIQIGTNTTHASIYYGMDSLDSSENGFYIGTDGISVGGGKFKVTAEGAITATGLTITGYATETYADNKATGAYNQAKSYYHTYVTDIDSNQGITIKPWSANTSDNNDNTNYIKLNASGLEIFNKGKSVALYGASARIGPIVSGQSRVEIASAGIDFIRQTGTGSSSYTTLAHIGYASGAGESSTAYAPYYTFGTRSNDTEATRGNFSFAEGHNVIASGHASHASGSYTTAGYSSQFVCGKFNYNLENDLFEVGNGLHSSAQTNAFFVTKDGDMYAMGSLYVNGNGRSTSGNRCGKQVVDESMFACGTTGGISTPPGATNHTTISFNKTFSSAPDVIVSLYSESTYYTDIGKCSCWVTNITTTGCTIYTYNGSSNTRAPAVRWQAMLV